MLAPAIREKLVRTPIRERYIDIFDGEQEDDNLTRSESREATRARVERETALAAAAARRPRSEREHAPTSPLRKRSLVELVHEENKEANAMSRPPKESSLPPFLQRVEAKAATGAGKGPEAASLPKEYMVNPFNLKAGNGKQRGKEAPAKGVVVAAKGASGEGKKQRERRLPGIAR